MSPIYFFLLFARSVVGRPVEPLMHCTCSHLNIILALWLRYFIVLMAKQRIYRSYGDDDHIQSVRVRERERSERLMAH